MHCVLKIYIYNILYAGCVLFSHIYNYFCKSTSKDTIGKDWVKQESEN